MADKRFKNSSIITGAQTKRTNKASQAKNKPKISFFPIQKRTALFTPPADQEELVDEIQTLRVSKKRLKEEIEDLRRLKKREDRKNTVVLPRISQHVSASVIFILVLVAAVWFFVHLGSGIKMTPALEAGLEAFSSEEQQELAQIFSNEYVEYTREQKAIQTKIALNQESLDPENPVVADGLNALKNEVFVEYQEQLGIMELQQVLFKRSAPDVANDLEQGISQVKSEVITKLKSEIAGADQSSAQEQVAQLANLLFLKSRQNAIAIMEITANLYNKQ